MAAKHHYQEYVTDEKLIRSYNAYQDKYKDEPRESDKVSIDILRSAFGTGEGRNVLDIACSTGNFLRHLRHALPSAQLTGADLAEWSVEKCRQDPELTGIDFQVADLLDLSGMGTFHAITGNAVTYLLDWNDYQKACASLFAALMPDGFFVGFELVHRFSVQDIKIVETSEWNPDGLTLHFRPMKKVEMTLKEAGFTSVEFRPFELPIDLPFPGHDADVTTYTRKDEAGHRMAFRGALYQPWCHMIARKGAA